MKCQSLFAGKNKENISSLSSVVVFTQHAKR